MIIAMGMQERACKFTRHCDAMRCGAVERIPGMTGWSKKTLCNIAEGNGDSEKSKKKWSREARWHNAQHAGNTVGKTDDMGSALGCKHVPKDDFTWCYVDEETAGKKANKLKFGMWCAS